MFAPGAVGGKGGLGPGSDGAGGRGTSLRSVSFCKMDIKKNHIQAPTTGHAQTNTYNSCNLFCVFAFDISNARRLLHDTFIPSPFHLLKFAYFRFP